MASRMPLSATAVRAALLPWIVVCEETSEGSSSSAVREEALLIADILQYVTAMSKDEVRQAFSESPCEAHLADALLAGGAAGEFDGPRMFDALRAAAASGSAWAPLWLGDMESAPAHEGEDERQADSEASQERRRSWYIEAVARGHSDASYRMAAQQEENAADSKLGEDSSESKYNNLEFKEFKFTGGGDMTVQRLVAVSNAIAATSCEEREGSINLTSVLRSRL